MKTNHYLFILTLALVPLGACSSEDENVEPTEASDVYAFDSRFDDASNVSYSGQIMRQVLVEELKVYMGGVADRIDAGTWAPADGDVVAGLDFYLRFDSTIAGSESLTFTSGFEANQATFDDISSDKDLVSKLAGNDSVTDHKDWSTEFTGWNDATIATNGGAIDSPEGLVKAFFETIDANAVDRANGAQATGPNGEALPVYVTADGQDLQQLTQKFLLVAVNFSQAADDYLDDDVDGKGLLADNTQPVEGANYTELEHAWDEAYGYFGASRDYRAFTDEELAGQGGRPDMKDGYWDANGDGQIDLKSEYNFGASINAGKRDFGAVDSVDFSGDAHSAFVNGRALITSVDGELNAKELSRLKGFRDQAIGAWEAAYAATAVHYINEILEDMGKLGTADYDFVGHAKHWSELKGFALGFQFNPRSSLSAQDFLLLHQYIGDRPVHSGDNEEAQTEYAAALVSARDLLGAKFGFSAANLEGW